MPVADPELFQSWKPPAADVPKETCSATYLWKVYSGTTPALMADKFEIGGPPGQSRRLIKLPDIVPERCFVSATRAPTIK
jgi:hypothetical protein